MEREFKIGDTVIHTYSGVIGKVIKFYIPTTCAEQTMIKCTNGRKFHAPTSEFSLFELNMKYGENNISNYAVPLQIPMIRDPQIDKIKAMVNEPFTKSFIR